MDWKAPNIPRVERESRILAAVVRGEHDPIDWFPLVLQQGASTLVVKVSSDALKLGGIRVVVNATTAQQIADVLGCVLPTAKISDQIYINAGLVGAPLAAQLQTPDAQMASTPRIVRHSTAIDAELAGRGFPLVATVGKDWVLTNRLVGQPNKSANYGWHDPRAKYYSPGGVKLWQTVGLAHDRWHVDYSQTLRMISRNCLLNGEPADLCQVLQDKATASLVSYEGALQLVRLQQVPIYVPSVPSLDVEIEDTSLSLGERCVKWCLEHVGHKEAPPGSNDSPLIRKWLAPCARGYGDKRVVLGISKANWCAAVQCAAMEACLRDGDKRPHDYRAGVVELVADTSPNRQGEVPFAGRWYPIAATKEGTFHPSVGDLAIWDRSVSGQASTSWWRHVNRVIRFDAASGMFQTVGGNENQAMRIAEHSISAVKLLGWIHYPQPVVAPLVVPAPPPPGLTQEDRDRIQFSVAVGLRAMADEMWKGLK